MYKDCLIFSTTKLGWMKPHTIYAMRNFVNMKTLEEQLNYIKPFLNVQIGMEKNMEVKNTWFDVLKYAANEYYQWGNGILLVWFDSTDIFGHAMPVINAKPIMGKQYVGEQLAIRSASKFIVTYIYKINY